jgi:5'-nucleotidase
MSGRTIGFIVACVVAVGAGTAVAAKEKTVALSPLGSYETGVFNEVAGEISAYDSASERLFVTNSSDGALDVEACEPVRGLCKAAM